MQQKKENTKTTEESGRNHLLPAIALYRPLLAKLNITLTAKELCLESSPLTQTARLSGDESGDERQLISGTTLKVGFQV
jgi:hypothetical protein